MGRHLEQKFQGMEAAVVGTALAYGTNEAARIYGVRHKKSFERWLINKLGTPLPRSPFDNWCGGDKHQWLRDNRDFIMNCVNRFGRPWTERTFRIGSDTFTRLLKTHHYPKKQLSTAQRALLMAEASVAAVTALSKKVFTQEKAYAGFTAAVGNHIGVQVSQAVALGLENSIRLDESLPPLEKPDLSVEGLLAQGQKWQRENGLIDVEHTLGAPPETRKVYLSAHPLAGDNGNHSDGGEGVDDTG